MLTRGPEHSELRSPDNFFHYATLHGLLSALEILCRDKAISRFADLKLVGKFLKAIFDLAQSAKTRVIGAGIETFDEFELLQRLGMVYAHGFYLAKPVTKPMRSYPKCLVANYHYKTSRATSY